MNRNVFATIVATVICVLVLALGFRELGRPAAQRKKQADRQRAMMLWRLAGDVRNVWSSNTARMLPDDLEGVRSPNKKDVLSGKSFGYKKTSNTTYELCATFATDDRAAGPVNGSEFWRHPKGDYCFQFDTAGTIEQFPFY